MKQVRNILFFGAFWLLLLLAAVGAPATQAWAFSAESGVRFLSSLAASNPQDGTMPTVTPTPTLSIPTQTPSPTPSPTPDLRRPEIYVEDAPLPIYGELAVRHGLTLSYRSKGVAPIDNNLLVQAKTISNVVAQIAPNQWRQVSEKTFEVGPALLLNVAEVTWITSTLPISWRGVAGIWQVNATNTGVNLLLPKQTITTNLSISKIFTDRVAATTAFTFTLRASSGIAAAWGDAYPTQFTVKNSCMDASWLLQLSSRERVSFAVPSNLVATYADVPWEIRHQQEPKLLLASGTIYAPVCNRRVYMPLVLR